MTIAATTNRIDYIGAGSAGPFTVPFRVQAAADLRVVRVSEADVESVLVLTTDYSVSGVGDANCSVTLVDALEVGETLAIRRAPALTQPTAFSNGGTFFGKDHEAAFDRLVMQVQSLQDQLDRSVGILESLDPSAHSLRLRPSTGRALVWQSSTELGNSPIDLTGVALPGQSRTVDTLTAYLLNNAVFNVKDYGALADGSDDTPAIQAAIDAAFDANGGVVYFPPGTYALSDTLVVPNGVVLQGAGMRATVLSYEGTESGILVENAVNVSGYGLTDFRDFTIRCSNAGNTNAGIDLLAGGYSYYNLHRIRISGEFKYGLILDATEITHVHECVIENSGSSETTAGAGNVWIVNGDQRHVGQLPGASNVITIERCQLNSGGRYGIVDDGGNLHVFRGNNFNGHAVQIRVAGVTGLTIEDNSFESHDGTGDANLIFDDRVMSDAGVNVGPVVSGRVVGNQFVSDVVGVTGVLLRSQSSAAGVFHKGLIIQGNRFGNQLRTSAIDLTKFDESCLIGPNADEATGVHYSNEHFTDGHTPMMFPAPVATAGNRHGVLGGDSGAEMKFKGGLRVGDTDVHANTYALTNMLGASKFVGGATYNTGAWTLVDTFTVTGAAIADGDHAEASAGIDLKGCLLVATITAADTVTVWLYNPTGANQTLGGGTWFARVRKGS